MILHRIKKYLYQIKTEHSETTIQDYSNLMALDVPEILLNFYKSDMQDRQKFWVDMDEAILMQLPVFFGQVIRVLSDISEQDLEYILHHERTNIYLNYHEKFIIEIVKGSPGQEFFIEDSFMFNGKRYNLPKSLKVNGEIIPGFGATALQFTEASDIINGTLKLKSMGFEAFGEFVAVYTMQPKYTQEQLAERINDFKLLTMDIVWGVFFYISKSLVKQSKDTLTYSMVAGLRQRKRQLMIEVNWRRLVTDYNYSKLLRLEYMATSKTLKICESMNF